MTLSSCRARQQSPAQVKSEIQKQLDKCVLAVQTKDIELYMSLIPDDFILYDENGEVITREMQRNYALRDWSIIDSTLNNQFIVDSLQVIRDSALVYTSQRWERLMFQRDGITRDTIVTSQKHLETWKKTKGVWMNYDVKELGSQIFINGKEYKQ